DDHGPQHVRPHPRRMAGRVVARVGGDDPPFHHPVFVLTRYPRDPLEMEGGTTFYFVTQGIEAALERAREAAEGLDVRVGGGVSTLRQYLRAGLVDEMHLAIVPVLLGAGERVFDGSDTTLGGMTCYEATTSGLVTHLRFARI